jgi:hypothetical protein
LCDRTIGLEKAIASSQTKVINVKFIKEVKTMATLTLTAKQIIELVKQLSVTDQAQVLEALLSEPWGKWLELSHYGKQQVRQVAAERGRDWDSMTEEEREDFICEVINED